MPAFGLPPLQPWHGLTLLHVAAVACGLLSYIGLTHSGRQRRPPSAAVAWVLALVAFPYLALPVYLLLGPRKLAHARLALSASPEIEVGVEPCARGLDLPPPRSAPIPARTEGPRAQLLPSGPERREDTAYALCAMSGKVWCARWASSFEGAFCPPARHRADSRSVLSKRRSQRSFGSVGCAGRSGST